jgi:tripartite-type tricarboxylate transporter receptor subunit TctC
MIHRLMIGLVACAAATLSVAPQAHTQPFPNKPITIIVPFAAGGPTDIVARVISERFTSSLGQRVIVENAPGAAGTTGMTRAARAPADGYTLLMGPMSTMSFSPTVYPNLPEHALKSFDPVGIVASAPIVLVAQKGLPGTMKDFVAHLKANAGKMQNGNAGIGSTSHLACALLNSRFGVKPAIVPYKGTAPALQDMLTGQVHYLCDQSTSVMGQLKGGGVRALAVLAPQPSPALPNVPTIAQAGYPGAEMVVWNALFAPKGTPAAIIKQLNAAIAKGVDDPASRARFASLGAEAPTADLRSPQALGKLHAADVEKWGKVIREAGIKIN